MANPVGFEEEDDMEKRFTPGSYVVTGNYWVTVKLTAIGGSGTFSLISRDDTTSIVTELIDVPLTGNQIVPLHGIGPDRADGTLQLDVAPNSEVVIYGEFPTADTAWVAQ